MVNAKEIALQNEFFTGLRPQHLNMIRKHAKQAEFPQGHALFREGEPSNTLYIIETGKVAIEAHEPAGGTVLVEILGAGDVVGWSWLFPPFVCHFNATTLEPTKALAVDAANLLVVAETDHTFGYELMKRVTRLVIRRLEALRQRLLDAEIDSILKG